METPSELAKEVLYYVTACGRSYTDEGCRDILEDGENYLLFYVLEGGISVTCDGRTMTADKGKTGFIHMRELEEYRAEGKAELLWMHLNGGSIDSVYQYIMELYDGFVFGHRQVREFRYMFKQLLSACLSESSASETERSRQIYDMLMHLLEGAVTLSKGGQPLDVTYERALRFIEGNIEKAISLRDIADAVNMSQYHFSRLFKKACGHSPYEYLLMARMDKAKYLLRTTDIPIKNIAQQVGYLNASTFSSVFTTKVGLSPKAFRAEAA